MQTKAPRLGTLDVEVHATFPGLSGSSHGGPVQSGTVLDDNDMHRMGKVQELKVRFHINGHSTPRHNHISSHIINRGISDQSRR
jgi:hypothetical protein